MTNGDLKYATNVSGSWVTAMIDSEGGGGYTSIATDTNNKIHISYRGGTIGDLKYITNASGSWVSTSVDGLSTNTSIAVDANNKVHISYYNSGLRYATNADITPPIGSISINSGAAYTNSTSATLTLSCTDADTGCSQMQFSNDNTNWSIAEAYATSKSWTLDSGDGTKAVYVRFKDTAGNWSGAFSASIALDTTIPVVSAGTNKTTNASFTQTATATDTNSMTYSWTKQSGPGTITFGLSNALSTTVSASADGTYTLRFTATDAAGNSAYSDMTLVWDTTAPTLNASASYVDSTHVDITFSEAVSGATTVSNYTANNGLTITAVSSQGGNTYRLTTSSQAIGGSYTVTANSITDLAGNAINAAAKTATFTRTANSAPSIPTLSSPANGSEAVVTTPTLFVNASTEPDGDNLGYRFEVSTDSSFATVNATAYVSYGTAAHTTSSWTVTPSLNDNTTYYWRVQASDGVLNSNWTTTASFFVNTANDAPTVPGISSPANGAQVSSLTPSLSVTNSTDVDNDGLTYSFDVATDSGFASIIAGATGIAQATGITSWTVSTTLNDNTTYYWRARATDEHGATSGYATGSFFVNTANDAPTVPTQNSPSNDSEAVTLTPTLAVTNLTDADGDTLSYVFEIDTVNTFDSANKQTSPLVASGSGTTTWTPAALSDNTRYYWRARANDGTTDSGWMTTASFFVNTANDAPTVPTLNNPANNAAVTTLTPSLIVNAATDIDNDALTYDFEVYGNSGLTSLVASATGQGTSWTVPASTLSDNTTYYWRARAKDEHGLAGNWMAANSFFVNNGGTNDAPSITVTRPNSSEPATNANTFNIQWNDSDPDSNATITLYYDTNNAGNDGVQIATGISEDDGTNSYTWDTSALPGGTYYVYAKIDDGTTVYAYSEGPVVIDRTVPVTTATPAGGTYTSAQSVTLSCSDGTGSGCNKIYYTTNGTTPTTSSPVYSAPISITKDTTLKFFAVDNAGNAGTINTETYVITAINAVDTTPPANPANLNATSNGDGSITLSWTAPSDLDLKGYNVYRDGTKINSQTVTATSYKDSSVTIGSNYTYKVTSLDLAGNESSGVTRTATSAVQANTPPSAPMNVKVEDTGTGYSLKIIWPANTESDLAGYKVYWGTASGTYTNSQTIGNATSYTITGLTEGTRYYIVVTAYDSDGNESTKSIEVTGTSNAYASRPDAPTGLTVTEGNGYLTLSWTGVSNVTGYMVYIGEADGVYGTPVRTTSTTYTFQNLQNGNTYYVAVSSYDLSSGSRYTISSESERTTASGTPYDNEAPAAPTSITATDAGTGGKVVLKWDREESFDIAGYVVAYKKTGNSVFEGITSTGVTWNYSVTGLTNGQSYTFYVYAYDANGNFSDPGSVTATPTNSGSTSDVTPPGIPTLSAAPGNGKVTLMITPPSDTDIDHYNLYVNNLAAGKYMPLASINGLSYEHSTGVDNVKALVFVATAVDASGNESGYSEPQSAVPNELPGDIPLEEAPPVLDRVDGYDVNEIAKGFGSNIGKPSYNPNADLDGNGEVDGNDLLILGTNHGKKK